MTIPMPQLDNQTILLAFVAVAAMALLLQALILLAVFLTVRKAARVVREEAEDLRSSLMPIIYNSRELYGRLAPKIETAVEDLAELAHGLRLQTEGFQSSAVEILEKLRRQASRLDLMFTAVLDAVDRAGGFVAETVSKPVRQVAAILSSLKAMIESLRTPGARTGPANPAGERSPSDQDMFV